MVAISPVHSDLAALCLVFGDQYTALYQTAYEVHRREIILAAYLFKACDSVNGHSIFKEDDCREHLNLQLGHKERALFGINANKACLSVKLADLVEVHVHDLASLEVFVEKGANDIVGSRDGWQELLFCNLDVRTVASCNVGAFFFVLGACGRHALLGHCSHHTFFLLIHSEVRVFLFFRSLTLLRSRIGLFDLELRGCRLLRGHHLFLDHGGLVGDGLLHNHVSEEVTRKLVVRLHILVGSFLFD